MWTNIENPFGRKIAIHDDTFLVFVNMKQAQRPFFANRQAWTHRSLATDGTQIERRRKASHEHACV
jgi:hypothetical protein